MSAWLTLCGLLAAAPAATATATPSASAETIVIDDATTATAAPSASPETIVIVDEDTPTADTIVIVDDGDADLPPAQDVLRITARGSAAFEAVVGVDTAFQSQDAQVGELRLGARLVLDVSLGEAVRMYAAPRLDWVGGLDRNGDDRELLYAPLPEAWLSWAKGPIQVRGGALVFDWGTSEVFGPNDVLNPPDLRRGITRLDADFVLPVLGAEAVGTWGPLTVRGVVLPVVTPGRFHLTGWDASALAGGVGAPSVLSNPEVVNPAFIDRFGDELLQTERPRDRPDNATLALRATGSFDAVDVSATVAHGWNPLPAVTLDPDLAFVAEAAARARAAGASLPLDDPEVVGALGRVQDAADRGAPLFVGNFVRRTTAGLDVAWALDPVILKADAAYATDQVFYTPDGQARTAPTVTAVIGAEYYRGESLQIWVEGLAQHILQIPGPRSLAYVEADAVDLDSGRSATWFAAAVFARYVWRDLTGELGALVSSRGDVLVLPRLTYRLTDRQRVLLGGTVIEGRADGLGGAYDHLDQVYVGYRYAY